MENIYPLESISIEDAEKKQFRMVECIMHHFTGSESLSRGDLGVNHLHNKPLTTYKAEQVIAEFFHSEDAIMVRGSGTSAIRYALSAVIRPGGKILVHTAPIYSTTKTSFEMFGLQVIRADFNDLNDIRRVMAENTDVEAALVQYARQAKHDSYDMKEVLDTIRSCKDIPIVTDDNYAVMKVTSIGVELGADLSCFSTFKLQGPEGIGVVVGKGKYIEKIHQMHYSGGSQTQGHEAMDVLRGLVYAPVQLAVQGVVGKETLKRLLEGEVPGIKDAFIANSQSRVLLVEFEKPIARQVLIEAEKLGALPNPVGAESKYEFAPLFYRVSGTYMEEDPSLLERMIRINPNRCGPDVIIEVLKKAEALQARFIKGIDADADAFRQVSEAYRMAKDDPARPAAIGQASVIAAEAPLAVMEDSVAALRLAASLPGRCNRNLLSDVYVASYCLYAGLVSAAYNVEANLPSIRKSDPSLAEQMSDRAEELKKGLSIACITDENKQLQKYVKGRPWKITDAGHSSNVLKKEASLLPQSRLATRLRPLASSSHHLKRTSGSSSLYDRSAASVSQLRAML